MYDCIVPAAGASSRMGGWKPGLPFRGGTILSAVVGSARAAGCRVLLVAGNRAESVPEALQALGPLRDSEVETILNPDWRLGMLGSLKTGMARVRTSHFFVLPGDMPFAPLRAFALLAREAEARKAAGLPDAPVFPVFRGEPGHPVLIPSAMIPSARSLPVDGRFRDFLDARSPIFVSVEDSGIHMDIDTPADYGCFYS